MAGIIAQMAANNRERRRRMLEKDFILPPSKSAYVLPPFEPCFDPKKHNQYLKTKELRARRVEILEKAKVRALELKKQEDYKLVTMLWNMKKESPHLKLSYDWAPESFEEMDSTSTANVNTIQPTIHPSIRCIESVSQTVVNPTPKSSSNELFASQKTGLIFDVINSTLGILGIAIFIIIFVVLFFIFANVDGKPWTSVFKNLF